MGIGSINQSKTIDRSPYVADNDCPVIKKLLFVFVNYNLLVLIMFEFYLFFIKILGHLGIHFYITIIVFGDIFQNA